MHIYKCDKCGKELKDYYDRTEIKIPEREHWSDTRYDLCSSCVKEIKEFIKNDLVIYGKRLSKKKGWFFNEK